MLDGCHDGLDYRCVRLQFGLMFQRNEICLFNACDRCEERLVALAGLDAVAIAGRQGIVTAPLCVLEDDGLPIRVRRVQGINGVCTVGVVSDIARASGYRFVVPITVFNS